MKQRQDAAVVYVRSGPSPPGQIVVRTAKITFFSPGGGHQEGADPVRFTCEHDAAMFEPGSETRFEILRMGATNGSKSSAWKTASGK